MGQSLPHHKLFAESHVAFHQVVHVVDVVAQQQGTFHAVANASNGSFTMVKGKVFGYDASSDGDAIISKSLADRS